LVGAHRGLSLTAITNGRDSMIDIVKCLEAADQLRSEIVLCLIGPPGIGKTEQVYEFARKHDRNVVEIIASQILPNEVSGITMPVAKTKSMEIYDHARLSSLKDGDILFFDELLQAAPATLSACLTLIQERRMMSGKMLPDVLIVASANPLNSPGLIPTSIRQRFMFIRIKWDGDAYRKYMMETYGFSVSDWLISKIGSHIEDDTYYNVLTPRTLTKLLLWFRDSPASLHLFIKNVIMNMFTEDIARNIYECYNNRSLDCKIRRTLLDKNMDLDEEKLKSLPMSELIEYLKTSKQWTQLANSLEQIIVDDFRDSTGTDNPI
jgi:hypothetical protein